MSSSLGAFAYFIGFGTIKNIDFFFYLDNIL